MDTDQQPRGLFWLKTYKWWVLAVVVLAVLGWWLLMARPMAFYRFAVGASEAKKEALEIQSRALATGAQIFLGLAVIVGAFLTWRRVRAIERRADSADRQVEIAQEGQVTERFTRAIEHLGSEEPEICLGGIYALERIAQDSPRDHPPVMEVPCALVREETRSYASKSAASSNKDTQDIEPPTTVVQAVLDVIGRNPVDPEAENFQPLNLQGIQIPKANLRAATLSGADLSGADLSGADLSEADLSEATLSGTLLSNANLSNGVLSEANLSGANLFRADLSGAELYKASFFGANLSEAILSEANLSGAKLIKANLSSAFLFEADLSGANFRHADLAEAILLGTDLEAARHLTQDQIATAIVEEGAESLEESQAEEDSGDTSPDR